MNLPNFVTLFRIILTPLMVIFLINGRLLEAFLAFAAAGVSDGLDGLLARWLNQKTRLGAILDPIADKLLLTSAYVTLAVMGFMPSWLAVVVISRDIIIVFGVLILFLTVGGVEIRPTAFGKVTTVSQLGTAFWVLMNCVLGGMENLLPMQFALVAATTVFSGLHYMVLGVRLFGQVDNGKHPR